MSKIYHVTPVGKAEHQKLITESCFICHNTHELADIIQFKCCDYRTLGNVKSCTLGKSCFRTWEKQCETNQRPVTCPCCSAINPLVYGFCLRGEKGKEKIKNKITKLKEQLKYWQSSRDNELNSILINEKKLQGLQNPEILKIWDECFVNMEIRDAQKYIVLSKKNYEKESRYVRRLEEEVRILEEDLEKKVEKKFVEV